MKQKITPCLWFDGNADQAMAHYVSIFPEARVLERAVHPETGQLLVGTVQLGGQELLTLNGGPQFHFTEAISLSIDCETQDEVDYYWTALSAGGATSQCGWLKDKFGVSWQVVPRVLPELLRSPDRAKAARVMQAMLGMTKLDVGELLRAAAG